MKSKKVVSYALALLISASSLIGQNASAYYGARGSLKPLSSEFKTETTSSRYNFRSSRRKTGYKPIPFSLGEDGFKGFRTPLKSENLPRRFDLRDENRVTSVKDQGPNGSCWAFATYASAESVLLPGEKNDFSEKHLRNTHLYDWKPDEGGNHLISTAYLANWQGPINEADDPYSPFGFYSDRNLVRTKDLDKVLFLPNADSYQNIQSLKKAIMDYGASYTTICSNEYYTNFKTMGHYNPGVGNADHAVAIVGWDDNYSRDNFKTKPTSNGAWIVKNSWGQEWGIDGGYFYISYEDAFVAKNNAVFFLEENLTKRQIGGMTNLV